MRHQALTYTAIALVGLAGCGAPEDEPAPANEQSGTPGTTPAGREEEDRRDPDGTMQALLDHVAASNDDTFEPEVRAGEGDNLQLDGPLVEGSWSTAGAGGMEYGQEAMVAAAELRCAADGSALIISVPQPEDTAEDAEAAEGDEPAEPDTADAESAATQDNAATRAGSLITPAGTVTGMFAPVEGRAGWIEMRIPASEDTLQGLPREGRIGIGLEGEETRLLPIEASLLSSLEVCVEPAPDDDESAAEDGEESPDNEG
ncbi:MAG: hypothetical protein CMH94_08840 [Oceanicaulis sp.]|nr:hypothetical protein [Maricaulis sp.]MBI75693.1 hypothetical protein [Oceanicaulis sp.]